MPERTSRAPWQTIYDNLTMGEILVLVMTLVSVSPLMGSCMANCVLEKQKEILKTTKYKVNLCIN